MPLKLHPPGSRKGNRAWIARGRIGGRLYEFSTRETDKIAAERVAAAFVVELLQRGGSGQPRARTFREAAEAYVAFRRPDERDEQRLARLMPELGDMAVDQVTQADLVRAIKAAWPDAAASSLNRNGIAPAAAVLHYAASNRWCEYRRVARFREPAPVPRALTADQARAIIKAAKTRPERLLVLFLFGLGQRITDTLRVTWSQIELTAAPLVRDFKVGKVDRLVTLPLPRELADELARVPKRARVGLVLPFGDRWRAYDAVAEIAKRAKVQWTPHMARHTLGTELARARVPLRGIMAALGHANVKSAIRYQAADLELVREAHASTDLLKRRRKR